MGKVNKTKNSALYQFRMFRDDGFSLAPSVEIPNQIKSLQKRLANNGRLDGPSAMYKSVFMLELIDHL